MKKISAFATLLLCLTCLLAQNQGTTQLFSLSQRQVNIPESGPRTNLVLTTPTHQFVFEPPPDARVSVNTGELRLTWIAQDLVTGFNFRLLTNSAARSESQQKSGWPTTLRERFPDAKTAEEFPCYSAAGEGRGFDMHYLVAGKFKLATRVARFPLAEGMAEFEVTTPEPQFPQRQMELSRIINSFSVEIPKSR